MDTSPLTYASAETAYYELERLRAAGVLSEPAYRAQLNALRLKDAQGRTWMLQERTGRWHVWERGAWTQANPPGREQAPETTLVPPEPWPPEPGSRAPTTVGVSMLPSSLPPPGVHPPPPAPDATSRFAGLTAQPATPAPAAIYSPAPAPVLPPPAAPRAAPPPPTLPPPATLAASTLGYLAQPVPGRAGKRARRRAEQASRQASRSRRGLRYVAGSILKWDLLWCLVAWAVYATVGERAPWALIPVAALALLTLVLWIHGLPRRHPGELT